MREVFLAAIGARRELLCFQRVVRSTAIPPSL